TPKSYHSSTLPITPAVIALRYCVSLRAPRSAAAAVMVFLLSPASRPCATLRACGHSLQVVATAPSGEHVARTGLERARQLFRAPPLPPQCDRADRAPRRASGKVWGTRGTTELLVSPLQSPPRNHRRSKAPPSPSSKDSTSPDS